MFVGHYSAALALKRVEKRASLGWLFIAAQFVDILFFTLTLLGIERLRLVENFTPSTHFELEFFPFSHGLVGSLVWAVVAFVVIMVLPKRDGVSRKRVGLATAAAVFSHWVLDLIVHTPDLPLLGDNSPKLGLGLWNSALLAFLLEALLLVVGLWVYLRGTEARTVTGRYGMIAFAAFLVLANGLAAFGPPPATVTFLAVFSLTSYLAFAGVAFWLDRRRS
jgi:hypothetical protein